MEYCPFYGEKWEGCRRCVGIDREENPPAFDNCFPGDEIDENEIHPYKCSKIKDMKEYKINGEPRYSVFCELTQKWIENWESYWEKQGKTWC